MMRPEDSKSSSGKRPGWKNPWLPVLAAAILLAAVSLFHVLRNPKIQGAVKTRETVTAAEIEAVAGVLKDVLASHELKWKVLPARKRIRSLGVEVPSDLSIPTVHHSLQEGLLSSGGRIIRADGDPVSGRVALKIGLKDSCIMEIVLIPRPVRKDRGRIAILIDDFGDRNDAFTQSFFTLPGKLTVSVLPGRRFSRKVAESALQKGREVILHLPMEPEKKTDAFAGYMIRSDMSREEIAKAFSRALADVPGAVGVNNHEGSKATADRRVMQVLLDEIRERDLFFVDSRTTKATVAFDMAREREIPCARRDVFLDNETDAASIRQALKRLMDRAQTQGTAVGIGHCTRHMLEVLREEIPRMIDQDFKFIQLSEAVR
ncbi:divergent polysaccharide deacetylase family protein [bacterium]|nr:divergent polysaccharide deacetylase family protein [bacterium]